jgi:hypothetical protein
MSTTGALVRRVESDRYGEGNPPRARYDIIGANCALTIDDPPSMILRSYHDGDRIPTGRNIARVVR